MPKKSKKRKHKKSSSSSSEEDERVSWRQDVSYSYKSSKRKHKSLESCAKEQKKSVKHDPQSTRHIKQPVYRLAKSQATEQKHFKKEEKCTKTVSVPFHEENCSSKIKNYTSGKDKTVSGSRTGERRPSKPLNDTRTGTVPQRTEKTSKRGLDEKSSRRSPSKLKKQLMSPRLVSAEREERREGEQRRKRTAEEPSRTRNDSSPLKTREHTSSFSKDSPQQKRGELDKKMCHKHQEKDSKTKWSLCTDAQTSSASPTEKSSSLAKHTASESSSKGWKNVTSVSHKTAQSSSTQKQTNSLFFSVPFSFKIPKKVQPRPVASKGETKDAISTNTYLKHGIKLSDSGVSRSNAKQETVQQAHSCLDVTPNFPVDGQDMKPSLSDQDPAAVDAKTEPWNDQVQLVKELHLARSEKRLEVDVMQSYGELTCMDIDSAEEGPADKHCRQAPQQDLIVILDTNILLSHLDYVKKMRNHGLGDLGFPVVLIPWVVLQELDSLKRREYLSGSVAHLAVPAISYIYNSLKSRTSRLWGQSMQQAAESSYGLNAENNDDRVLQCCLQYKSLYPECALILCTNDKNLCSKALLSGVTALCKNDLEAKAERFVHGLHIHDIQTPMLPQISPQVSSPMLSRSCTSVQPHSEEKAGPSVGVVENDSKQPSVGDEETTKLDLSRCVSGLEACLREVLSDVLEVEMKAAYEDLWLEIVYLKPPWTLEDVLQCLKKHWIAVFGQIVPRKKLQNVLNLINFFSSGETVDRSATSKALQEAKELVEAFGKRSSHVPRAISVMDNISNKLQPQLQLSVEGESPASDIDMKDVGEDRQPTTPQVSHKEVWEVFEIICTNVFKISLEVFKALGFDPHTMQSAQPMGGPPPPQDALACLHRLRSMVSQLLQAFSSVLSSAPGLEEVQALLSVMHSNKIVTEESKLTAKDLLDCFSQPYYWEKLGFGGSQLMELQEALDRCVRATGQHTTFTTFTS